MAWGLSSINLDAKLSGTRLVNLVTGFVWTHYCRQHFSLATPGPFLVAGKSSQTMSLIPVISLYKSLSQCICWKVDVGKDLCVLFVGGNMINTENRYSTELIFLLLLLRSTAAIRTMILKNNTATTVFPRANPTSKLFVEKWSYYRMVTTAKWIEIVSPTLRTKKTKCIIRYRTSSYRALKHPIYRKIVTDFSSIFGPREGKTRKHNHHFSTVLICFNSVGSPL